MINQVELLQQLRIFQADFPIPIINFEKPVEEVVRKLSSLEKKKSKNYNEFFLGFKRIKGSYNQNWRWNE